MLQLKEECIIMDMQATSKEEALRELAAAVHAHCTRVDPEEMVAVLREREQVGSTGVGNGVAIPHGKIPGLNKLLLCFGRSRGGISFDAIDQRPVHLFVQILSPAGMADEYLQALARIARLLKVESNRARLLRAETTAEIMDLFNSGER